MVRAAVMVGPKRPIEIQEFAYPVPEDGAVIVRTLYSEVCGTDVHLYHGRLSGVPYPIIPGHVSVGEIEAIKGHVKDVEGEEFRQGGRVTFLDVHETCGRCWYCLVAKATTRCPARKVYGITYSAREGLLGGWSERIYLKPGVKIIRLPEGLSPETYIGGGCGLPTAFHAVERARMRLNDTVVIQGSGPVGLSAVAFARLSGAGTIVVAGAPAARLDMARRMGANLVLDIGEKSVEERLRAVRDVTNGRGADVVIEATGNPVAIPEGLAMTRDNGTYVVVGQYTDCGEVSLNPHRDLNKKHVNLYGCWGSDFSHFYRSIQVMARHQNAFPWHLLAQTRYPLEQANQALRDVEELKVIKAIIAL
jgi:threonine dehydrogenase-like Zn-dependent dehydrogenase